MNHTKRILPSIIAAPFDSLGESIRSLEQAGMELLHFDVMDGHFVPNLTLGPLIIQSLNNKLKSLYDVHLMVTNPETQVEWFNIPSVRSLTVHIETIDQNFTLLSKIRNFGKETGITLNPPTDIHSLDPVLDTVDQVLVMTVHPGFSGQKFMPEMLSKAEYLANRREQSGYTYRIQMDGGIGAETVSSAFNAGVDEFVAGSAIFHAPNPLKAYRSLCQSVGALHS